MVAEYAGCLDRDPRTLPDLKLAAKLAAGQLHGASTLYGVLRLVGEKAGKLARGKLRLTTSKLEGLGPEDMNEVAFFLASTVKSDAAMSEYGSNPQTKPGVPMSHPALPDFYMTILKNACIQTSASRALDNLHALYSRAFCLLFDETVFKIGSRGP